MNSDDEAIVQAVVAPLVAEAGFDLEEVSVRAAGTRRLVRVVIDSDEGVALDTAADLSRRLSAALDDRDDEPFGGRQYTLEVTSRGVASPLTEPRHFRRAVGRLASFRLVDGSRMTARIAAADDRDIVILGGADGLTRRVIARADIERATVEVEFSRPSAAVEALLSAERPGHKGEDQR